MIPLLVDTWPDFALLRVVRPHTKSGQIHEYVYKTHLKVQSIRATS